jgi:hypothetical protein
MVPLHVSPISQLASALKKEITIPTDGLPYCKIGRLKTDP